MASRFTCSYRIEKEKNHLNAEVSDLQSQVEHVNKGKVKDKFQVSLA